MSTSEITEALQKSARLRGEVERLERRAPKRRSLVGRAFSFVTVSLTCLVLVVLAVDGWFAYDAFCARGARIRSIRLVDSRRADVLGAPDL